MFVLPPPRTKPPTRTPPKPTIDYMVMEQISGATQKARVTRRGTFPTEHEAVDYIKKLALEDRPTKHVIDLTSCLEPQKSYKDMKAFVEDKEAMDTLFNENFIGLGYHYEDVGAQMERVLCVKERKRVLVKERDGRAENRDGKSGE